jgi:D-3-phosphoglycerate dehydrogenase
MSLRRIALLGKVPEALPAALVAAGMDCAPAALYLEQGLASSVVGLITSSEAPIPASEMDRWEGLRVIGRAAAGTENIDLEAAGERGVAVLHIPLATAPCAAELAMAHIVALLRGVPMLSTRLREGFWGKHVLGSEARGCVLGIVGLGRVGSRVSRLARAFGMKRRATDPYIAKKRFRKYRAKRRKLHELLKEADVITLHTPLTEETRGMIGARELALMRPGSYLVNCARGGIVDEEALYAALVDGHLAGAAIDTWVGEPKVSERLLSLPNVLPTPHIGAATRQAKQRMVEMITQSVCRYLDGLSVKGRLV